MKVLETSSSEVLSRDKILRMYETMFKIRQFEERVRKEFEAGNVPGFVHLYAGQEANAVGVCSNLRPDDGIVSTHRGHGHCIAKGVDIKLMLAELLGKRTGLCKGKGGSMHVADVSKGMFGANAIVGGGFPTAVGLALAFKYKGTDSVSVCFFGDGAANQGTFHEALNLAAIWKLPVLFFCENNGYAEDTPVTYHLSVPNVSDRAAAYSMPGEVVDGTDVLQVYHAAKRAVDRARRGEGPTLIDSKCYRKYGHYIGDPQRYKTDTYVRHQTERDPLSRFTEYILGNNLAERQDLKEIEARVLAEIEEGWRFAVESPLPKPEEALEDVYAKY